MMVGKRPGPGPDIDEIDGDLRATPEEIEAELGDGHGLVEVELTDELDLHAFSPKECHDVVTAYLDAAREAGFTCVRIVHGKGTGTLRRIVHSVLGHHPAVSTYGLAADHRGWGATVVELKPAQPAPPAPP
jgi:DNA-nicking Smr family endonuclease